MILEENFKKFLRKWCKPTDEYAVGQFETDLEKCFEFKIWKEEKAKLTDEEQKKLDEMIDGEINDKIYGIVN